MLKAARICHRITSVMASGKNYYVHDNGNRPYRVTVKPRSVEVHAIREYRRRGDYDVPVYSERPTRTFVSRHAFIGRDPKTAGSTGNTLLVHVSSDMYVFIGATQGVYAFHAKDEIRSLKSPLGNSDVPYPYAIGRDYTYLLLEHVCIRNSDLPPRANPYNHYYSMSRSVSRKRDDPNLWKLYKRFRTRQILPRGLSN